MARCQKCGSRFDGASCTNSLCGNFGNPIVVASQVQSDTSTERTRQSFIDTSLGCCVVGTCVLTGWIALSFLMRFAVRYNSVYPVAGFGLLLGLAQGIYVEPQVMLKGMQKGMGEQQLGCVFGPLLVVFGWFGFAPLIAFGLFLLPGQILFMLLGYIELETPVAADVANAESSEFTLALWICTGTNLATYIVAAAIRSLIAPKANQS